MQLLDSKFVGRTLNGSEVATQRTIRIVAAAALALALRKALDQIHIAAAASR